MFLPIFLPPDCVINTDPSTMMLISSPGYPTIVKYMRLVIAFSTTPYQVFQKGSSVILRLSLVSGLRELDAAPRRFLFFIVFNVISWQCIVGPVLVLLGRKIDMPPSWIGYLTSSLPLSMLLVMITGHLVRKLGPKRLMFTAWMMRNILSCLIFLMPFTIVRWGNRAGWYMLAITTLSFCLMRAVGGGGWFPWLHEVVPEKQRGAYFSAETALTQLLNVLIMLAQAYVLQNNPKIWQFLVIYGVGIAAGLISLLWMARIPGGRATPESHSVQDTLISYRGILTDSAFMRFAIVASLCFSCTAWFNFTNLLYMRDILHVSPSYITLLMGLGSVGVMLTIHAWRDFAETRGSGVTLLYALGGYSVMVLLFILLLPGEKYTSCMLIVLIMATSIFGAGFWMAVHRAMLGYVKVSDRIGYSNIWTVLTSLAFGITPILAGHVIDHYHASALAPLRGYRICLLIAGLGGLICALVMNRVVQPDWSNDSKPDTGVLPEQDVLLKAVLESDGER